MLDKKQTLYERIGGEQAIGKLIHEFYNRVLADQELKPFFKSTSMDKLRRMQREFFRILLFMVVCPRYLRLRVSPYQ